MKKKHFYRDAIRSSTLSATICVWLALSVVGIEMVIGWSSLDFAALLKASLYAATTSILTTLGIVVWFRKNRQPNLSGQQLLLRWLCLVAGNITAAFIIAALAHLPTRECLVAAFFGCSAFTFVYEFFAFTALSQATDLAKDLATLVKEFSTDDQERLAIISDQIIQNELSLQEGAYAIWSVVEPYNVNQSAEFSRLKALFEGFRQRKTARWAKSETNQPNVDSKSDSTIIMDMAIQLLQTGR